MSKLPNKKFQQLVLKSREKNFYKSKEENRKISWPEYNESQIKDAFECLNFIREAIDKAPVVKQISKTGRPLTDPKILAKAVLACELLDLTEREAEGWIKILKHSLEINIELDDKVIGEAYNRIEVALILKWIFNNYKSSDGKLSGDGTGLETSRRENYESTKYSGEYLTSIVDSREIVQAFDADGKQECQVMHELILEVKGSKITLDAGFVDRKLVFEINNLGIKPYIFPKKNLKLNGNLAWKHMYLSLYNDVQVWLREYHERSHSESFHSSFKRRNNIITKRNSLSKLVQITARIIIHNKRRQVYYELLAKKN